MSHVIRELTPDDQPDLRACIVALQDFERTLDPRLRAGEEIADAYHRRVLERCQRHRGQVFVAVSREGVVGFAAVVTVEPYTELDEPPGTFALVTDLMVLRPWRGLGLGRRLLERA